MKMKIWVRAFIILTWAMPVRLEAQSEFWHTLVTEKTRDAAYLAPTSMITQNTWYSETKYIDSYPYLKACISSVFKFNANGMYHCTLTVRVDDVEETKYRILYDGFVEYEVSFSGVWQRYLKSYLCIKMNLQTVRVKPIIYHETPIAQLSERRKAEMVRMLASKKKILIDYYSRHQGKFPNDDYSIYIHRLDNNYLAWGDIIYMSESVYQMLKDEKERALKEQAEKAAEEEERRIALQKAEEEAERKAELMQEVERIIFQEEYQQIAEEQQAKQQAEQKKVKKRRRWLIALSSIVGVAWIALYYYKLY